MAFVRGVYDAERAVRTGKWLYAGEAVKDVRIVFSPICLGKRRRRSARDDERHAR